MKQSPGTPTDLIIGKNLRNVREAKGLSTVKMGKVLNVSYQQVQNYEKGKARLSATALVELCRILNVPVTAFLKGIEGIGLE